MRRFFNGAHMIVLTTALSMLILLAFVGACGSDNSIPKEAKLPPGEHAQVTEPTTTTTSTTIPPTEFVTFSRGEDKTTNYYLWHGTIDGVDCILYGPHMFCKGYGEK